jgi:hypothetical protein
MVPLWMALIPPIFLSFLALNMSLCIYRYIYR